MEYRDSWEMKPAHLPCQSFQRLLTQAFTFMHFHDVMQVCGGLSASLPCLEEVLTGTDGGLGVPAGHTSPPTPHSPADSHLRVPYCCALGLCSKEGCLGWGGVEEIVNTVGILSYGDFEESIDFLKFFFFFIMKVI